MKKRRQPKVRVPKEVAAGTLRHRGGPNSSHKGERGYDREKEKEKQRRLFD